MDCMKNKDPITFDELIEGLMQLFKEDKEKVDIDEVVAFFNRYENNPEDWKKFSKWDKYKYTRNLIHEGNGNFNLILMCWPEDAMSAIHDHSLAMPAVPSPTHSRPLHPVRVASS